MKKLMRASLVVSLLYSLFLLIDVYKRHGHGDSPMSLPQVASSQPPSGLSRHIPSFRLLARQQFQRPSRETPLVSAKPHSPRESKKDEEVFAERFSSASNQSQNKPRARWETQELKKASEHCQPDRDCAPRGRDGVLMVGASFAVQKPASSWQGVWDLGSNVDRSPLLHLR